MPTRRDITKLLLGGVALALGFGAYSWIKGSQNQPEITSPESQPEQGSTEKQSESYQQPKGLSEPKISEKTTPKIPEYLEVDGKKIKNIWTDNPDYVGKKIDNFKVPQNFLTDIKEIKDEEERDIRIIRGYIYNENFKFQYNEVYRNGKLFAIAYLYETPEMVDISTTLYDINGDGITDKILH